MKWEGGGGRCGMTDICEAGGWPGGEGGGGMSVEGGVPRKLLESG